MSVGDIIGSASAILSSSQRRAADAAHNIANITTPGFRAKNSFTETLNSADGSFGQLTQTARIDFTQGSLTETGVASDFAIDGDGFFELRDDVGVFYTRSGQFERAADGRLLGIGGRALQGVGGGDIVVPEGGYTVTADGSIMEGDQVIARVAVMTFDAETATSGADGLIEVSSETVVGVDAPMVRQGFLENSNVSLGDEMVVLMEAVRRAETGQRLMNVYDDLMGRAITTFGQGS